MGQWQQNIEDTAFLFQWSLVYPSRNSLQLHLTHQLSLRSLKQCTLKNVGKSSGVRDVTVMVKCCLVLYRFFKSNLFGLCPLSDQVTIPQDFGLRTWCFLNARKPKMMPFHQRT